MATSGRSTFVFGEIPWAKTDFRLPEDDVRLFKNELFDEIQRPKRDSTFAHPFGDYIIMKAEVEKSNGLLRHNVVPGPRFLTGEFCIDVPVRNPAHVEVKVL